MAIEQRGRVTRSNDLRLTRTPVGAVGIILDTEMRRRGLTVRGLSKLSGVGRASIHRAIRGQSVSLSTVNAILKAIGLELVSRIETIEN